MTGEEPLMASRSRARSRLRQTSAPNQKLVGAKDDFRPVLEMHRVVVIPLATPDEAVPLKNLDDLPGNLVSVEQPAISVGLRPLPIMRMRGCNIDRDPQTVRAFAIRACDQAAVVGALGRS